MIRDRLYGIGEPLTVRCMAGEIDADRALDLMAGLGVRAFREWMNRGPLFENPDRLKPEAVAAFTHTFDRCRELDIEVTGVMHGWFLPESCRCDDARAMPERDLTPGSAYMQVMEMQERSWHTLASAFPQVRQWETGNENNAAVFLHPVGWRLNGGPDQPLFPIHTAMQITADLMYYSAKGIRKANPEAKVVSFSATPAAHADGPFPQTYAICLALEELYKVIEAGESFSTNTDDYFDMVAWHPYLGTQMGYAPVIDAYPAEKDYCPDELPDARWRSFSDCAYAVMARHGDGRKPVLITEFGFSDVGDPAREVFQAQLVRDTFAELEKMPYVKTIHFFRLFEQEKNCSTAGEAFRNPVEAKFGIATEDYVLRLRGKALKDIYTAAGRGR